MTKLHVPLAIILSRAWASCSTDKFLMFKWPLAVFPWSKRACTIHHTKPCMLEYSLPACCGRALLYQVCSLRALIWLFFWCIFKLAHLYKVLTFLLCHEVSASVLYSICCNIPRHVVHNILFSHRYWDRYWAFVMIAFTVYDYYSSYISWSMKPNHALQYIDHIRSVQADLRDRPSVGQ